MQTCLGFNKLQDVSTKLGSKDTFLKTLNSLLNYNCSFNIQFIDSCLSVMPQSNSKNTNIPVSQYGKPFKFTLANVLHK